MSTMENIYARYFKPTEYSISNDGKVGIGSTTPLGQTVMFRET